MKSNILNEAFLTTKIKRKEYEKINRADVLPFVDTTS